MNEFEQYKGQSGEKYHSTKHDIDSESVKLIYAERKRKFQPHINHLETVLEYGVGCGWNLIPINCGQKYAYDIAEHLRNIYTAYDDITFVTQLDNLPAHNFDVIICHHVLEHLDNPVNSLSEIKGLLAENGRLILCVPYECQRRFNVCSKNDTDHHLYTWNIQTLCNLLERCGFVIEEARIKNFGYERYSAIKFGRFGQVAYSLSMSMLRLVRPVKEIMVVAKKKNG